MVVVSTVTTTTVTMNKRCSNNMDISFSNKKIKTTTVITSIIRERNTISLGKAYNYRGRNINKNRGRNIKK